MSLLKTNEIQNYNGSSLTLTASTVSTSAQLNTGGNISVTGSLNVSDDSTTRTNLGLGTIATQDSDSITVTGGTATLGALTVSGSDSGDLVRITQTGSGNALVVEDSANPDSTPFVVDASGNVVIGGNTKIGSNLRLTHIGGYPALVRADNLGGPGISLDTNNSAILPTTHASQEDNAQDLGSSGHRWKDAYVVNGVTTGSDANEKTEIATSELGLDFINKINPVSYKFIGRYRTHYGMISQEIETLLGDVGKTSMDFAGFIKSPVTDDDGNETGEYRYGLRYAEFISPMIKAIQQQQTIIESQQSQIDALTARIETLETT